jgi:hypothetical protein
MSTDKILAFFAKNAVYRYGMLRNVMFSNLIWQYTDNMTLVIVIN